MTGGGLRRQVLQQAQRHVLEVGETLADVRVLDAGHPGAGVVAYPLHRRLGGQAADDGFADAADPAGIPGDDPVGLQDLAVRSEEHTSELQSLMRISYAVFCLKKKKTNIHTTTNET